MAVQQERLRLNRQVQTPDPGLGLYSDYIITSSVSNYLTQKRVCICQSRICVNICVLFALINSLHLDMSAHTLGQEETLASPPPHGNADLFIN